MYPDRDVAALITQHFLPVRVHAKDNAGEFKRLGAMFDAQWTPTTLMIDPPSTERHRIEGFLPSADFLAQLTVGLGHSAFARSNFAEAERWFREVVERYPDTETAAEALYWAGVAKYKATGNAAALHDTALQFLQRYQGTSWAKKASVWN